MNHLPIMRAKALYQGGPRSFEADLAAHLQRGFVWSGDTEFVMARLVSSKWVGHWNDLEYAASRETGDTWLVWMAALAPGAPKGDGLRRLLKLMPFWTPYVAWHRRGNRLRVWSLEDLLRRLQIKNGDDYGRNQS